MVTKISDFQIRVIDVSDSNGYIDWQKVKDAGITHAYIRVGFGRVIDSRFVENWKNAKGKVIRIPYWYLDYYSNHNGSEVNGIGDTAWGTEQANNCFDAIKNDNDGGAIGLDIENGGKAYSPPIAKVPDRVNAIAEAFVKRAQYLNKKGCTIYTSLGTFDFFSAFLKSLPLWVAWYNLYQTVASVLKAAKAGGWTGVCYLWQLSSDADGHIYGAEEKDIDVNVIVDADVFYALADVATNPSGAPNPVAGVKYTVTALIGLRKRSQPNTNSKIISVLPYRTTITVSAILNGWAQLVDGSGYVSTSWIKAV